MTRVSHRNGAAGLFYFAVLATFFIILFSTTQSQAQTVDIDARSLTGDSIFSADAAKQIDGPLPAQTSFSLADVAALEAVSVIVTFDDSITSEQIASNADGLIVHNYNLFKGASIVLPGENIDSLAALPGVTAVYLDELNQPVTDNSPDFIGAPVAWQSVGGQTRAGNGVLFASLDSGVWPEHPSFSDPDGLGNPYDPPITGPYPCEFGNSIWNPNDLPFACNNKLVGAYGFLDTYKMVIGLTAEEFDSARDDIGHGTHTAATAAGNANVSATIAGSDLGLVTGIAPRAQIIAYKVCGLEGCFSSDIVAAIEQAIADEVDVINYSISGGHSPYTNIVSLAFLRAYENDIFVAKSAGNNGPDSDSVGGRAPWVTTVAASTQDRSFRGTITLAADQEELQLAGVSLTASHSGEVVLASNFDGLPPDDPNDGQCLEPFPAGTWTQGEIVVCERGQISRVTKGFNVLQGGAGGFVLYNSTPNTLVPDNHFLPAVHLQDGEGAALLSFVETHTAVIGTIEGGIVADSQGNMMALFSSRGGPEQVLGVSKPDLTAPGVQILAGHTPLPSTIAGGAPGELFQVIEGTSMSAPHVAGSAILLKQMHPDWSPGQIKSALMTTAYTEGVVKEDGITAVDPFDAGSGHIDLTKAGDPGITISASGAEFLAKENDLWNSNYPSLYVPQMPGRMTINRYIKSELSYSAFWEMRVEAPEDLHIIARGQIGLRPGGEKRITFTIDAHAIPMGEVRHATLFIEEVDGPHVARFPITIVRESPEVSLEKRCVPAEFYQNQTSNCSIMITNMSFDTAEIELNNDMPRRLRLVEDTVSGAVPEGRKNLRFNGELAGAEPPLVTLVDGSGTTAGYIPLANFGIPEVADMSDESIVNFTLPEFIYGGTTHNMIGMVSNGYAIVDGGSAADVDFQNQSFPDPAVPNNVLAPFWTDLNPSAGGKLYAAILSDPNSGNAWVVLEWDSVVNFSDNQANSFQLWIGINGTEDIAFVYGEISGGNNGLVTIGAENKFGNSGQNWFINGAGNPVAAGDEIRVISAPGEPGASHQVTYQVTGWAPGPWKNCAEVVSNLFDGTNIACFSGEILKGRPPY